MEHPTAHAERTPARAAVIDERSGRTLSYAALEERSRAVAHRLWDAGLRPGDHVALAVANRCEFYEFCWAAHRIGLYYTAVNTHLTAAEARHVVTDCGAEALLTDGSVPELPEVRLRLALGEPRAGHESYEDVASASTGPLPHEGEGEKMLYTSGTTGVPKGVARPLSDGPPGSVFLIRPLMLRMGFGPDSVLVNPAPLYHSAPLSYGMGMHRLGGTVVIDGRFDAARCLAAMQRRRATHGVFVPTMFSRMLALPDHERYDVSALVTAAHGAAPCPERVKRAMIGWWGPRIVEYYGSTEGAGMTMIDSHEWLEHPGSVGRPVSGAVHILDTATGEELGPGETGAVYFSGGARFRYHADDAKTASAYDALGRNTVGDIGHVDDDGYLYLTDRASFTVISGGVNVYPREAENVLALHPLVDDVGAFGVPDDDLGEILVAVVALTDPAAAGDDTATALTEWCTARLARQKCPRRIAFTDRLPRTETGKHALGTLRSTYGTRPPARPGRPGWFPEPDETSSDPRLDEEAAGPVTDTETDTDRIAIVEKTIDAYNTKNWGRYALFFREDLRYCHHNRGFEFSDRATFLAAMRVFASDLAPNRTLGPGVRCVQSGDVVVREQVWSGKAIADFPGIADAGEDFRKEVCSVFVFDGDLIAEYHEYG